jgi:hypothetical protein
VVVETFTHTPRLKGLVVSSGRFLSVLKTLAIAGDLVFFFWIFRGLFLSWLIVGMNSLQITNLYEYTNVNYKVASKNKTTAKD